MSLTLSNHTRHQANLAGHKPRIGVEVPELLQNFSRSAAFDAIVDSDTDGTTDSVADNTLFTDAGMDTTDFIAGDILIITSGSNAGDHIITNPQESATSVICAASTFDSQIHQVWSVVRRYQDLLAGSPNFKTYSKELGGYSPQSDLSLGVVNQGLWSDIFATYANPENGNVDCKLFFDDETDILLSESLLLYTGKIKTFPNVDYEKVDMSVGDSTRLKNRIIGSLIEETDASNGSILPTDSLGKMKPIIYGDFRKFADDATASNLQIDRKQNFVPAVYLGQDASDKHRWYIAGHQVDAVDEMWCWDEDIKRMVKLTTFTVEQNTSAGCIISHANLANVYDFWYPDGDAVATVANGGSVSQEGDLADGDKDSYASFIASDTTRPLESDAEDAYVDVFMPPWDHQTVIDAGNIVAVDNFCRTYFDDFAYVGNSLWQWIGQGGPYDLKSNAIGTIYNVYDGINGGQTGEQAISETITFHLMGAYNTPAGLPDSNSSRAYLVFRRIEYTPIKFLPVFFGGRGREYGTWVNDRDAAEGYTTDHADNDASGMVIENGAGIVESLFRDELGMGSEPDPASTADTDILRNSFNIASSVLTSTEMCFAFLDQHPWEQSINPLAQVLKSTLYFNYYDRVKMVPFDGVAGFSASIKTVPNNWDIFEFSPIKTFKIITGYNDQMEIDGTTYTISEGEYTGASLAVELSIEIGISISVSYSSTTGKFTFTDVVGLGDVYIGWNDTGINQLGRFLGFDISAADLLSDLSSVTSDFGLWADSWVENPIIASSFRLSKQNEDVITDVTVNYYKNISDDFQGITSVQNTTYHSDVIENIFDNIFTKDLVTAQLYRDFLIGRLNKKHYVCSFSTFMNAVHVEMWDVINIRHPILDGIFTAMDTKEWVVLDTNVNTGSMEIAITAIEV